MIFRGHILLALRTDKPHMIRVVNGSELKFEQCELRLVSWFMTWVKSKAFNSTQRRITGSRWTPSLKKSEFGYGGWVFVVWLYSSSLLLKKTSAQTLIYPSQFLYLTIYNETNKDTESQHKDKRKSYMYWKNTKVHVLYKYKKLQTQRKLTDTNMTWTQDQRSSFFCCFWGPSIAQKSQRLGGSVIHCNSLTMSQSWLAQKKDSGGGCVLLPTANKTQC